MSQCPYCQEYGAYVGALFVDCPNSDCQFFSQKQLDWRNKRIAEILTRTNEELAGLPASLGEDESVCADSDDASDPDKTPVMPWGLAKWPTSP